MFENAVNIQGHTQLTFNAGTTGEQHAEKLTPGVYDVWAAADVYLKLDQSNAADVTTTSGYLLRSGNTVPLLVTTPSYLGAASATGTPAVFFHKVK